MPEIIRLASDDQLAEQAAQRWLDELQRTSAATTPYCVALAGGRIAAKFLEAVAILGSDQRASFKRVHFFWSDERAVPPDSDESNFGLAHRHLLTPLAITADHIHRIRGEMRNDQAALLAETAVRQLLPFSPQGQPIFDLVLLGMGEDGHIASLFPNHTDDENTRGRIYLPVVGPKPPPQRVTLSYSTIAAARQVWVLASGTDKQDAWKSVLSNNGHTPLKQLIEMRTHTHVFTDLEA